MKNKSSRITEEEHEAAKKLINRYEKQQQADEEKEWAKKVKLCKGTITGLYPGGIARFEKEQAYGFVSGYLKFSATAEPVHFRCIDASIEEPGDGWEVSLSALDSSIYVRVEGVDLNALFSEAVVQLLDKLQEEQEEQLKMRNAIDELYKAIWLLQC